MGVQPFGLGYLPLVFTLGRDFDSQVMPVPFSIVERDVKGLATAFKWHQLLFEPLGLFQECRVLALVIAGGKLCLYFTLLGLYRLDLCHVGSVGLPCHVDGL